MPQLTPQQLRALRLRTGLDARTVRRVLAGEPTRTLTHQAVIQAAEAEGIRVGDAYRPPSDAVLDTILAALTFNATTSVTVPSADADEWAAARLWAKEEARRRIKKRRRP
jgi:hypothetical protein